MNAPQLSDAPGGEIVLGWFKTEWPKEAQHPDIRQCRNVSARLQAVVDAELGQARSMNELKTEALKANRKALSVARATMRRSIPQIRKALQTEVDKYTLPDGYSAPWPPLDDAILALAALGRAEVDFQIVSETLSASGLVKPNPAAFIAEGVRAAWGSTSADPPLSATEGAPMTGFVQCALKSIGMVYGDHSIIAAIKGSRALARRHGKAGNDSEDDL
jgi:hypothetical protein